MKIRNVIHKGLRRFIEKDDPSGLPPAATDKIRDIVSFLQEMEHTNELRKVPKWKAHQLTGNRRGTWALNVTRNWRITFRVDEDERELFDLNFENYH